MSVTRINGVEFDGSTCKITFGVYEIPFLSADYGDSLKPEPVRECGSQEIVAMTPGQYEVKEAKIKFRSTVFRELLVPRFTAIGFGNQRVQLVVNFYHPEIGADSDLLQDARLVDLGAAIEASNKGLEVETTWQPRQVLWTSARKRINVPSNGGVGGGGFSASISAGISVSF